MDNREIVYLTIYVFIGICSAYIVNDKQFDVGWVVLFPIWYFLLVMVIQLIDKFVIMKGNDTTSVFYGSLFGTVVCFSIYSFADLTVIIYNYYNIIMWLILIALSIILILSLIIWNLLHFAKSYENIIITRKVCITLYTIFVIAGAICLYIVPISYIIKTFNRPIDHHFVSCLMVFVPILLRPDILFAILEPYFTMRAKIHLTNLRIGNYALFLRCFKYDNNIEYDETLYRISEALPKSYKVLQIGNPQKIFKGSEICETFYLPTIDWQKWVSHYINESQFVFIIVNNSNGVLWEILNHDNLHEKFILYFPNNMNIDILFNNGIMKDAINSGNTIANILYINKREIKDNCFCFIKNNHLYTDNDIFSAIQKYFTIHTSLSCRNLVISNCNNYIGKEPKLLKGPFLSFLPLGPL